MCDTSDMLLYAYEKTDQKSDQNHSENSLQCLCFFKSAERLFIVLSFSIIYSLIENGFLFPNLFSNSKSVLPHFAAFLT